MSGEEHSDIFVLSLYIMLLSIDKDRPVGQRGSLGGCIPSLDWPGAMHISCVICVLGYGHHHERECYVNSQPHHGIIEIPPDIVLLPTGKDRLIGFI